jgi:hypothetical protein
MCGIWPAPLLCDDDGDALGVLVGVGFGDGFDDFEGDGEAVAAGFVVLVDGEVDGTSAGRGVVEGADVLTATLRNLSAILRAAASTCWVPGGLC